MFDERIIRLVNDSVDVNRKLVEKEYIDILTNIANEIINAYRSGNKILIFGNGGSAADAQHFATELVCRFEKNRAAINAISLTTNTSLITAIGNDFGFEDIFSRQVEALSESGDIVIGISTSGNSPNVIKGIKQAKINKAKTIGMTGLSGKNLEKICDLCFSAPSNITARIQECHILAIHIICSLVEGTLFGDC